MPTKKQLQEENEKLKKDLEFQTKQHNYYYAEYEGLGTMLEDAKDKQAIINRLKEENEKLKTDSLILKKILEDEREEENEWRKIDGADGLMQDLFYDGYTKTK